MTRGRPQRYLNPEQLKLFEQAVTLSEDLISDRLHLTISAWKKYRYDIRTLKELRSDEITDEVFAQIVRYARPIPPDGMRLGDFYSICLQDHNLLRALRREPVLNLYPLLVYVLTHELVHVVRFYKFFQFFEADFDQKAAEEERVHQLTYEMLRPLKLPDMPMILDFYSKHRRMVD